MARRSVGRSAIILEWGGINEIILKYHHTSPNCLYSSKVYTPLLEEIFMALREEKRYCPFL